MFIYFLKKNLNKFILLVFLIKLINCNTDILNENLPYLFSFKLLNNKIIVFSQKGYLTYDTDLSLLYNFTFSTEVNVDFSLNEYYPSFSQFQIDEGAYALSYFAGNIYFFNNNGLHLKSYNIQNNLIQDNFIFSAVYNIISYKTEDNSYFFFLIYIHFVYENWKGGDVNILYYKIDSNEDIELIKNESFEETDYDLKITDSSLACQRVIQGEKNYLICFYEQTSSQICKIAFEPESFSFQNRKCINGNNFKYVKSVINDDYSKIYVCYTSGNGVGNCFYYNINNNAFSSVIEFGHYCTRNYYIINLYYFRVSKEYIFSCGGTSSEYYIIKFQENLNYISPNITGYYKIQNCVSISSFSIIYLIEENSYMLLSDTYCSGKKDEESFKLNTFFNSTIIITPVSEEIDKSTETNKNNDNDNETSKISLKTDKLAYPTTLISDSNKVTDIKVEPTETNSIEIIEVMDSTEKIKNTEIIDINKETEILKKTDEITDINMKSTEVLDTNKETEIFTKTDEITYINIKSTEIREINKESELFSKTNDITNINIKSTKVLDTNKATEIFTKTNEITDINIKSTEALDTYKETEIITKTNEITDFNIEPDSIQPIVEKTDFEDKSFETNKILDTTDINEKTGNIIDICNDDKKIMNSYKKCVCNNKKGYYPLKSGETIYEQECYNMETKPSNFYLNEKNKYFEVCYESCKTCIYNGNEKENNCTSCIENFILEPYIPKTTNCVPKCNFYYFYTYYRFYSCTFNYHCPKSHSLLIRNKSQCTDNCTKDDIYRYQYNGECINKCPDNTKVNGFKCEIKNTNLCSLGLYELKLAYSDIETDGMESLVKNYAEEFNYTNNQIVNYTNNEYSLVIYKNSSCIEELSLKIPKIDFSNCYSKIKSFYNISGDLIIAILDKYIGNENPITSYILFNPLNGEKINASEICKDENIIIKENILFFPGIDSFLIQFFAEQGINVFNVSDRFFVDICFRYKSPNKKDIPLNYRLKLFFPNISLCDDGCISKGVDLKTMESICNCPFTEFSKNILLSNTLKYVDLIGDVFSFITESSFGVLFCYKNVFIYEYFKKCIGGFIIMIIIFFQTICVLVYIFRNKFEVKKYIFILNNSYIHSFKNLQIKKDSNNKNNNTKDNKMISLNKKNKKIKNNNIFYSNKSLIKAKKVKKNLSISESPYLSKKLIPMNDTSSKKMLKSSLMSSKIFGISNIRKYTDKFRSSDQANINFKKYLSTDLDDMDYDDVVEKDKRGFCRYFFESLKKKQLTINTFFVTNNIKPKSLKIIVLLLTIDFYCLFNAFMFNESFIKDLYNSDDTSFFSFINLSIENLIYVLIITKIIKELILCYFFEEKKIKGILKRGKYKPRKIKMDIVIFLQKMEKYYKYFIYTSYFITVVSWFYISCFNDVYYYSQNEWIKSSFFSFIVVEIISIFISLFETILRYLSLCSKNEKIFKLSKIFE